MQFECKEVLKLIDIHINVCTFARIQLEKKNVKTILNVDLTKPFLKKTVIASFCLYKKCCQWSLPCNEPAWPHIYFKLFAKQSKLEFLTCEWSKTKTFVRWAICVGSSLVHAGASV